MAERPLSSSKTSSEPHGVLPFLKFPRELRDQVYKEVSNEESRVGPYMTTLINHNNITTYFSTLSSMLGVCRQIHEEFKPYYCSAVLVRWECQLDHSKICPIIMADCLDHLSSFLSPTLMEHVRILQFEFTDRHVAKQHDIMQPRSWSALGHRLPSFKKLVLYVNIKDDLQVIVAAYLRNGSGRDPPYESTFRNGLSSWLQTHVGRVDGQNYDWVDLVMTFDMTWYEYIVPTGKGDVAKFDRVVHEMWAQHKVRAREEYIASKSGATAQE